MGDTRSLDCSSQVRSRASGQDWASPNPKLQTIKSLDPNLQDLGGLGLGFRV